MAIEAIAIEAAKAAIIYGFQELRRAGMSEAEAKAYVDSVRTEFYQNNPENIPDTGGGMS